jgi:hypothetical protein
MKRYHPIIYSLITTVIITVYFSGCKSQQLQFIEMKNLFSKNMSEKKITGIIKLDTLQKQTEQGLRFSIILKNDSDSSIPIENILNRMVFDLTQDNSPSAVLLGDDLYSHGGPKRLENTNFLKISALRVNNVNTDMKLIENNYYTLRAHTTYEISIAIPRVLNPINHSGQKIPVPAGRYHIYIGFGLFTPQGKEYKTILSGEIPITYGK